MCRAALVYLYYVPCCPGASLREWFASSDNKLLLNQLRQAGIQCCQEDPTAADGIITPNVTGALSSEVKLPAAFMKAAAAALAAKRGSSGSSGEKSASIGVGKSSSSSSSSGKAVLEGLSVCITGVIADERFVNRQAVGDYITSLGGEFINRVNKITSWLVVSIMGLGGGV
jgi:NAD-dependent DNA ligase